MDKRIGYYDLLRGIAVIGVVAIHSTGIGYAFNDNSFDFIITVVWRQIINFSVPMFISLSGFFLANKDTSTKEAYFSFVKKQIPRVFIPYLLWSVLYLGLAYVKGASIGAVVFRLFTFQSSVPFYFIILIIEYYLLLPVLQKMATPRGLALAGLVSVLSCLLVFYFQTYQNISLPMFIKGAAPSWVIFFVLGLYVRNNKINLNLILLFILIVLGIVLSVFEGFVLYYEFGSISNSVTAVKISSFIYSTFVILLAFKCVGGKHNEPKFLVYIGEVSFGIFLSHIFFVYIFNYFANSLFPAINESAVLRQVVQIAVVVLCSVAFAALARRISLKKAVKYFGQ